MNQNRFDRMSQTLADTRIQSRRGVIAALGIAVLGALAGVDADAASAKRKSRRHTKRKTRHDSRPRQNDAHGRLRASSSRLQPKPEPDSRCEFSRAGDPCQEAACSAKTTLQPACSCDEQRQCICPPAVTCPNHLVCLKEKGVCLTDCRDDFDCAKGATCQADGTCAVADPGLSCVCSNLNFCSGSGNGWCTEICTCVCNEGWTGADCSELPPVACSDHLTREECEVDVVHTCVFCASTQDGATGVCVPSDVCLIPVE